MVTCLGYSAADKCLMMGLSDKITHHLRPTATSYILGDFVNVSRGEFIALEVFMAQERLFLIFVLYI